jgi:hypothetical protein
MNEAAKSMTAWAKAVETGFLEETERSSATIPAHRDFIDGVITLEELSARCDTAYTRYKQRCRAAWAQVDEKAIVLRDEGDADLKAMLWDSDREAAQKSLETLESLLESLMPPHA